VLFLAVLSLFGQNDREVKIFIQPIEGKGRAGDNIYIEKRLAYEVIFQYHAVVKSINRSEFNIKGTIESDFGTPFDGNTVVTHTAPETGYSPVPDSPSPHVRNYLGRREFFSMETGRGIQFYDTKGDNDFSALEPEPAHDADTDNERHILTLEMFDSLTGEIIGSQAIVYYVIDDSLNRLISIVITNMLSDLPDSIPPIDTTQWREKWLFFEISALWSPRIYQKKDIDISWANFGLKLSLEWHFISFMSLGIGAQVIYDGIDDVREISLEIPALLKFVFKLTDSFNLEPYGGAMFNYPLLGLTLPSRFSWFAGVQAGIKAEPGMFVIDPRFAMDFYKSGLPGKEKYNRYSIQLGIGYKLGIGNKTNKNKEY